MIDDFLLVNSGSTPPAPRAQSPPAPAPEESETPYQPFVLPAGGDDNDLPEGYSASDDEVAGYIAQAKVKAVRAKGVLLTSAMFFAAVSLVLFAGAAGRGHMMKVAGESDAEGDVKAAGRGGGAGASARAALAAVLPPATLATHALSAAAIALARARHPLDRLPADSPHCALAAAAAAQTAQYGEDPDLVAQDDRLDAPRRRALGSPLVGWAATGAARATTGSA
eukprot:CAMPEP_0202736726 /NCGR_PEP_ID=MMETSP1388-20130828/1185_1 /ASSEMBLY_ACC=CAM_ASM_000864 /TAXON_ID=37098 /ORGANISM="Isochrysis sp, Strain CCMP1244" /LENGTH=223 /DNA_ID=CAMNT_0049403257 /DNA_START=20 /DNA_END=691 /DNA_ORIENTATION=-